MNGAGFVCFSRTSAAAAAAPTGLNNLGDAISPQTAS